MSFIFYASLTRGKVLSVYISFFKVKLFGLYECRYKKKDSLEVGKGYIGYPVQDYYEKEA
jgi:hypothetical protein